MGVPATQMAAWQVSAPLQTLPSAHGEPSDTGAVKHPATRSQLSVVQGLESLQASGVPAVHTPPWQVSWPLQMLASGHDEPSGSKGFPHTPPVHTSLVHGLPSAQSAFTAQGWHPGICVFWQPLTGAQPSVVQGLASLQERGVPAVQTPLWQISAPLHTLPSAHEVPFSSGIVVQPKTGLQPSVVQGLASLQPSAAPAVQTPLWQVSLPLQTLASAHEVPSTTGVVLHPKTGSQLSVVQTLLSLQPIAVPGMQTPLWQVSAPLHTLPSLHEVPLSTGV
jgi:hypothetical protein